MRRALAACLLTVVAVGTAGLSGQAPLTADAIALRTYHARVALDRYLETWNSRDPATWATSLNFPHVRPGAGVFEMTRTPQEYAAGVNFEQTLKTGWHHSEWVSMDVLQIGVDKVHVAGKWQRYSADGRPMQSSVITYIITNLNGHWGVQARFATGAGDADAATVTRSSAAGVDALNAFMRAWNSGDPKQVAAAVHYPHVRLADGLVEVSKDADAFLAGPDPGRQRTWPQTRIDQQKVVQVSANGVTMTVNMSRLGRDGKVLSKDEGAFLAILRDGVWKIQARSMMGS